MGRGPKCQPWPPSRTAEEIIRPVPANGHLGETAEDGGEGHEGGCALGAPRTRANRQAGLELDHDPVESSPGKPDLESSRQTGCCHVAMSSGQGIERERLHVVALPTQPDDLLQERSAMPIGRGRHRTSREDPHGMASREDSMASSTRGQV